MTSRALLRTYRALRDVIADIQDTAATVDNHVGRFQIFGTKEDLAHAVAEAASLREMLQDLELQLGRCAPKATGGRAEAHGPVQSTTELSQAGVP